MKTFFPHHTWSHFHTLKWQRRCVAEIFSNDQKVWQFREILSAKGQNGDLPNGLVVFALAWRLSYLSGAAGPVHLHSPVSHWDILHHMMERREEGKSYSRGGMGLGEGMGGICSPQFPFLSSSSMMSMCSLVFSMISLHTQGTHPNTEWLGMGRKWGFHITCT